MDFAALLKAEREKNERGGAAQFLPPPEVQQVTSTATVPPAWALGAPQPPPVSLRVALEPRDAGLRAFRPAPTPAGPRDLVYAPDFISVEEEAALREALLHPAFAHAWTALRGRSCLNFGGTPTADGIVEGVETVIVTLTDGASYDLGAPATATATVNIAG